MGITAPTNADKTVAIITSLTSYNRPLVLLGIFALCFLISFLFFKKNPVISAVIALIITALSAIYLITNYIGGLRY